MGRFMMGARQFRDAWALVGTYRELMMTGRKLAAYGI